MLLVRGSDIELNSGPDGTVAKLLSICHANILYVIINLTILKKNFVSDLT